jgi:hypothetical protein
LEKVRIWEYEYLVAKKLGGKGRYLVAKNLVAKVDI